MRLFGKKIIPGVKIEVDTDNDGSDNNKNGKVDNNCVIFSSLQSNCRTALCRKVDYLVMKQVKSAFKRGPK